MVHTSITLFMLSSLAEGGKPPLARCVSDCKVNEFLQEGERHWIPLQGPRLSGTRDSGVVFSILRFPCRFVQLLFQGKTKVSVRNQQGLSDVTAVVMEMLRGLFSVSSGERTQGNTLGLFA